MMKDKIIEIILNLLEETKKEEEYFEGSISEGKIIAYNKILLELEGLE